MLNLPTSIYPASSFASPQLPLFSPMPSYVDSTGHLSVGPPAGRSHSRHSSSPDARQATLYPPTARSASRSPQRTPEHSPRTFAIPDFSPRTPSRSPRLSLSSHHESRSLFPASNFDASDAKLLADALLAAQPPERRRTRSVFMIVF